jgi:hypothetical protein
MSIYPFKRVGEELYDGSCFEGIPVTEQYHAVGENEYLLPGISWFGPAELMNMKMATIVIPYYGHEGGAIEEGLAYESESLCRFKRDGRLSLSKMTKLKVVSAGFENDIF